MNPRRVLLAVAVAAAVVVLTAVVAFVIVPLFVRSTVNEPAPVAATASAANASQPATTPAASKLLASGRLQRLDPVHYGSGEVRITQVAGQRFLRFENVDIAGAPNMFVYLSDHTDGQPGRYTDLGALKATNGSFNYAIPTGVDLGSVRSVVVWCRAFSVTVTFAALTAA